MTITHCAKGASLAMPYSFFYAYHTRMQPNAPINTIRPPSLIRNAVAHAALERV